MMKYKIPFLGVFTIFLLTIFCYPASATLEIFVKKQFTRFNQDAFIDTTKVPLLKVQMRAEHNGKKVSLDASNILIIESNLVAKPVSVGSPDADGWQAVEWYTKMPGATGGVEPLDGWLYNTIVAVYSNEVANKTIQYYLYSLAKISISNVDLHEEKEFKFGMVPAGTTKSRKVKLSALTGWKRDDVELPVRVDSVKTHTSNFEMKWLGSAIDKTPPPVGFVSPFDYLVDLTFKPNADQYYYDKLSVYYEGGRKEEINLIGNKFDIERKTILNVVQPNGGEILTPCQQYTIKWVGAVKGLRADVEYSTDAGITWKLITYTDDSSTVWTVPSDAVGDSLLIRVRQNFDNTQEKLLRADNVPVQKVAYRNDASKLLAINQAGSLFEWNLTSYNIDLTYKIPANYPGERIFPFGAEYLPGDKQFVVGYTKSLIFSGSSQYYLSFFNTGTVDPVTTISLDKSIRPYKMMIDSKKQYLAIMSDLSNQVRLYSPNDGTLIRTLDFPYPVTAMAFSAVEDKAVFTLLDGEIRILSLTDFSTLKSFDLSDLPIIVQTAISPNGKLLSVGCRIPEVTIGISNSNEIHVIDVQTGMLVRTMRKMASNPVGLEFNPSSNVLTVGSQAVPQISFMDLPTDEFIAAISGSEGMLTDFRLSPEGHSIAVSSGSYDNLTYRTFTYPESDISDNIFRVVNPVISISGMNAGEAFIATENEKEYTTQFCNTGLVPVVIEHAWLKNNIHFRLKEPLNPDTLFPGECKTIKLVYFPLDTGKLTDTLNVLSCSQTYMVPIESHGRNRHITFYNSLFDFGELCIGETIEKEIQLARNDDPVPLTVNSVTIPDWFNSPFEIIDFPADTIIPPGGSIMIKVRFKPGQLGDLLRSVVVSHSGIAKFNLESMLKGFGIGAVIQVSHNDLRFIPEIKKRKIKVINKSNKDIKIESITFNPEGIYSLVSTLPIDLTPEGESELEISWNGNDASEVNMLIEATPCAVKNNIQLGIYSGTSILTIPTVEADPRGGAVIPVNFRNVENRPYMGQRYFETEISINPRMFLPQSVTSSFGKGELIRNEIVGDKRIIGIRVEGDFQTDGTVAEIHGVAGLAETDISPVEFNNMSAFWGVAVNTTTNNGIFKLINVCGDKFLVREESKLSIISVSPNPVSDYVNLEFEAKEAGEVSIELFDFTGNKVTEPVSLSVKPGIINIPVSASSVSTGNYKLVVRMGESFAIAAIVVVR